MYGTNCRRHRRRRFSKDLFSFISKRIDLAGNKVRHRGGGSGSGINNMTPPRA